MKQSTPFGPTVNELRVKYFKAQRTFNAATGNTEAQYAKLLRAFSELCATPSTSIADIAAKHEAFLVMEVQDQRGQNFNEVVDSPLSDQDMVLTLAVSVYRDLRRLANT